MNVEELAILRDLIIHVKQIAHAMRSWDRAAGTPHDTMGYVIHELAVLETCLSGMVDNKLGEIQRRMNEQETRHE